MQFIFYGILSALTIGFANALSKKPGLKIGADRLLFFRTILTCVFLLIVFLVYGGKYDLPMIGFALLISLLAYAATLAMYHGFTLDKVGLVSPIASTYSVITIILSVIFFHVALKSSQIIAITVILVGVVLINLNLRKKMSLKLFTQSNRGIVLALITSLAYGIFFFLAQIPTRVLGQYETSFLFELGILIFSLLFLGFQKKINMLRIPDKENFLHIFLVAAFTVISVLLFYTGLKSVNYASIVLALNSSAPLVVILLGRILYKEKLSRLQIFAGLIITAGIVSLSLVS